MTLNQLQYFVSVASCRSFTKAAEQHFLSQTAITQQIRLLEDSLGVKLISRDRRPIELTDAGKVFYHEARAVLGRMDEAVIRTQEASAGLSGMIRIGYEKGYERSDLSARLRVFHLAYPNILFTCVRDNTDRLAELLEQDKLDVIFAWDSTNLRQHEDTGYRIDLRSPLTVALYGSHPFAMRKSLRREDLKDETILYMTPAGNKDSFGDARFMALYEEAGYQPRIALQSSDCESLLIMVAAEEGITILPSYTIEKLNNAENLIFVPLEGENEYEEIFMIWKKTRVSEAVSCFLKSFGE